MSEEIQQDQDFARGPDAFPSEHEFRLHCLRHSAAHIMAAAIQQIHPEAKFAIGPPVKDRFYYDMLLPSPLSTDDLQQIECLMNELVQARLPFRHETWTKREAINYFGKREQVFKVELINGIKDDVVSIYRVGDFTDLCLGPHVKNTDDCAHFKLTSVSGAYWHGDETKPMLQRIYGTVWPSAEELEEYLHNVDEAKRRDHRKLGRDLDLFMTHDWAPGAIFWLPKGTVIYQELQNRMRHLLADNDYLEVKAPILMSAELFKKSGHWDHYQENMFLVKDREDVFGLKPMNCPGHMLIFGAKRRSYRELPLRLAEQTILHRNERRGVLSGLTRVRQFQQDDAHIFITEDQIGDEVTRILRLMSRVYSVFDMPYRFVLSTRDPSNFMGDLALWERAEASLRRALDENSLPYEIREGEAAFYGPKIDQLVEDSLKREHQLGTIQADFQLPRKFELTYVNQSNCEATPVVIHRALYGSLERFIGILVEHFAGAFPAWLAPVQVSVLSVSEKSVDYSRRVAARLQSDQVRVHTNLGADKIGAKIRDAQVEKTPYMLIVGSREAETDTVSVRSRDIGDEGVVPLESFVARIKEEISLEY